MWPKYYHNLSQMSICGKVKTCMHLTPSRRSYRIGIDARLFRSTTGGIGRYSRELLAHLFSIDQVNEYTVFLSKADVVEWDFDLPNVEMVVVEVPHYSYAEQVTFLRILNSYKFDLVHFLNFNHPILYRRPYVVTIHDFTLMLYPEAASKGAKSKYKQLVYKHVLSLAIKRAKRAIAITENTADDAEKLLGIPHARMELIYLGGPEKHEIPFGSKKRVQDYLGTRDPYILFWSQWRSHKGIQVILPAFERFKEATGAPHKLVLVGRQEAAPQHVRDAIAASPFVDDIVTPGFAPDELLPSIFAHATMYVMPSFYEGFGLPPLEAMTYGTPVILADNSSLPEIGGDAALYFPTGDVDALAERMQEVLFNPQMVETLRQRGFSQAAKFSWHECAKRTLGLYRSILDKKR